MQKAPQIFHTKEEKPKSFVMYPTDLFAAINTIFSGNEAKVMLALLGCKGDGSFSPSTAYMQKVTGITLPNNYYKTRKQLEKKGYIEVDEDGNLYIDTQRILAQAKVRSKPSVDEQSES